MQDCRVQQCKGSRDHPETARRADKSASLHFEAREHSAEISAVIAVVEQADVPAPTQLVEEFHQRAWPFGKLEPVQPLVPHSGRMSAHHVAHVQLGHLVVREVHGLVAGGGERFANDCPSCLDRVATPTNMCALSRPLSR